MSIATPTVAARPRAYVRVHGRDAEDFLQRMLSNDVAGLRVGESCDALLLTAKARVIAPLRVWRRSEEDFLLGTEPELGESVRSSLLRARFAAKCEIEPEEHASVLVWSDDFTQAEELVDADIQVNADAEALECARIEAGVPAWGKELDDSILPAEAGLDETHISFTKGCYPGQEPIARLHYRGKINRRLRRLVLDGEPTGEELVLDGKVVGRITSRADGRALGYVRTEVPEDAVLEVGGASARLH